MDGAADGKVIENVYHTKDVNIGIVISQAPQLDSKIRLSNRNIGYIFKKWF
jgi:hypothetical protein